MKIVNETLSGKERIHCQGSRNFNTVRPRQWYFTVFDCNSTEGLQLSYKMFMTNDAQNENDDEIICKNGGQKLQSYFLLLIGSWVFAILTL